MTSDGPEVRRASTSLVTWVAIMASGPVVGGVAGIAYSLAVTVPQWIHSPSSAGGTGSAGLSIMGAILGAIIGCALGTAVSGAALVTFALMARVTDRDPVRILITSVVAACCVFVLWGSFGDLRDPASTWEASGVALGCLVTAELILTWSVDRTRRGRPAALGS